MTEHARDLVVAEALRRLPIPDHAPEFWVELEDRLAAEVPEQRIDERVETGELPSIAVLRPEPVVPVHRRLRFLAVAAAVAVVALAAGVALQGGGGDGGERTATTMAPFGATGLDAPPRPEVPTTPVGPVISSARPLDPVSAVRTWIDALGAGDLALAADLLGPLSRASAGLVREAPEGYGAWAAADPDVTTVAIPDVGEVVVLSGTWRGDGAVEERDDAIPTVPTHDGSWLVEPFAGSVRLLTTGDGYSPDVVFEAASADAGVTFWFALDGAPAEPAPGGTWDPPDELLTNGTHRLVVAVTGDAVFAATAVTFVVEG